MTRRREPPAMKASRERKQKARAALDELTNAELFEVLSDVINRRRLDTENNRTDPLDLYTGVTTGLAGLLGRLNPNRDDYEASRDAEMVKHIAAVGRGVKVRSENENAGYYREIATYVSARWTGPPEQQAASLAIHFARRFGGPKVDAQAIDVALQRSALSGKVTDIAIAVGIEKIPADADKAQVRKLRNKIQQNVVRALSGS